MEIRRPESQISGWLAKIGLSEYVAVFEENGVDLRSLGDLSEDDLKELGVKLGHRRLIQRMVAEQDPADLSPANAVTVSESTSPTGEADRRQLTIMFADLVGSTQLSTELEPEDLRELNRQFQEAASASIEQFGGFVARYMGDGVLAYFGYPQAHEDDAERAVRSALGLTERLLRLKVSTGALMRVGMATGQVIVGDIIGDGASQESAVTGETPNLAARLQSVAEPGTLVIDKVTHSIVASAFETTPHTSSLKGFASPVPYWEVVSERKTETRFEARGAPLGTFVGRSHELGLLLERWGTATTGDGQVALVYGEPGLGKSRLTEEFTIGLVRLEGCEKKSPVMRETAAQRCWQSQHFADSRGQKVTTWGRKHSLNRLCSRHPIACEALRYLHLRGRHPIFNFLPPLPRIAVTTRVGEVVPHVREYEVLRNSVAPLVHEPKVVLRICISLLGRAPIPHHRLGIVLRNTQTMFVHEPEVVLRHRQSLFGRAPIPHHRLGIVLMRNTQTMFVHEPEVVLRHRQSLFGRAPIPHHRLGIVLVNAPTLVVHDPEVVLCSRQSLFGRAPIPHHRLGIVLRNALTHFVHEPEVELRTRESLFGRAPIPHHRLGIVLRNTLTLVVHPPEVVLRRCISLFGREQREDNGA